MIILVRLNEKEITLRQLLDTEADLHLGKTPLDDVDDDVKQLIRERLGTLHSLLSNEKTPFDRSLYVFYCYLE